MIDEASGKAHLVGDRPGPTTLVYRFDKDAAAVAALQPGDIAVLAGIAYRKVVQVNDVGDALELTTERTTLNQAIKNGTIEWDRGIDFPEAAASGAMRVSYGDAVLDRVASPLEGGYSYEGELKGWKISVRLVPSEGRLDVEATATKEVLGEKRVGLTASGHVQGFRTSGRAVFSDGANLEFEAGTRELEGELKVKVAAFNSGASQELLSIPLGIEIPVEIGPVPLLVKIKAHLNVTAELSLNDSSAEAEVTFRFRSNQGIQVAGSSLSPVASLQSFDATDLLGGSADYIAAGINACLEFPRIEISMLGEFASVGLSQNNCAESVFTFDPACNQVKGVITGVALYNLGFFGISLASGNVQLYHRESERHSGDCR
jgi:hypothetical protein